MVQCVLRFTPSHDTVNCYSPTIHVHFKDTHKHNLILTQTDRKKHLLNGTNLLACVAHRVRRDSPVWCKQEKKNNRVIVTNQQTIVRKDCIKQENQAAFYLTIIE